MRGNREEAAGDDSRLEPDQKSVIIIVVVVVGRMILCVCVPDGEPSPSRLSGGARAR